MTTDQKTTLYMVATPIGNLQDITLRALDVLSGVDAIVCEQPMVTSKLLLAHAIRKPLVRIHQHSTAKEFAQVIARLERGETLAYVSDAGTPGVSDPGGYLVQSVIEALGQQVSVIPIGGISAVTTMISVAGIPMDQYVFFGFPPHKKGRNAFFYAVADSKIPVVFYESTHRIIKSLSQLADLIGVGERWCVVGRELTKRFESLYRGTIPHVIEQLTQDSTKGEFVVIVSRWIPRKVN